MRVRANLSERTHRQSAQSKHPPTHDLCGPNHPLGWVFRATAPSDGEKSCPAWYGVSMERAPLPLRLAAVVAAVGIGWTVALQVHGAEAAQRQRIAELNQRSVEQRSLAVYVMKQLAGSDEIWDGVDAARRRVEGMGRASASSLPRRLAMVENIDAFAGDASAVESEVLDRFGERYGASSVAAARRDLASAVRDVADETRHWSHALREAADASQPAAARAKVEFAMATSARERSVAARASLSADWTAIVALLRAEADDTRIALSKTT